MPVTRVIGNSVQVHMNLGCEARYAGSAQGVEYVGRRHWWVPASSGHLHDHLEQIARVRNDRSTRKSSGVVTVTPSSPSGPPGKSRALLVRIVTGAPDTAAAAWTWSSMSSPGIWSISDSYSARGTSWPAKATRIC